MATAKLSRIATVLPDGSAARVRVTAAEVVRCVYRTLEETVLCAIATVAPGARAHVSTAYFCYSPALELFFWSHPRSRHGRNLGATPSTAIAVYSTAQRWGGPDRGVQLFGTCAPVRAATARAAERRYARRFPGYAEHPVPEYRFYRFVTTSLQLLDEAELGDGVLVRAELRR